MSNYWKRFYKICRYDWYDSVTHYQDMIEFLVVMMKTHLKFNRSKKKSTLYYHILLVLISSTISYVRKRVIEYNIIESYWIQYYFELNLCVT